MDLWARILSAPNELADDYHHLWHEQLEDPRTFYDMVRTKFNATPEAHSLLYLLNRCVKAAVRYNKAGEFNQSADHRRLGAIPERVRSRLIQTSRSLAGSTVFTSDYAPLLMATPAEGVCYMDPPYQGVTNARDPRYMAGLERPTYEGVLRQAVSSGVSFIVSYDVVTADNAYGEPLDSRLGLTHVHVAAGRSSQATLSGQVRDTVESLYLSPAIVDRLGGPQAVHAGLQDDHEGWSDASTNTTVRDGGRWRATHRP